MKYEVTFRMFWKKERATNQNRLINKEKICNSTLNFMTEMTESLFANFHGTNKNCKVLDK